MRELGWTEGQNIVYDRVYADDQPELLTKLAAELVARKPELIYAPPVSSAVAAKHATQTIPIVFIAVGLGLVASLARPGGNASGCYAECREAPHGVDPARVRRRACSDAVQLTSSGASHRALAAEGMRAPAPGVFNCSTAHAQKRARVPTLGAGSEQSNRRETSLGETRSRALRCMLHPT